MKTRWLLLWLVLFGLAFQSSRSAFAEESPLSEAERSALTTRFQDVIEETTAEIVSSPGKISLYSARGDARFFSGDFEGAVADYEMMVRLDPQSEMSHWRRGIAYFYAKNYEKAARQFEIYHTYDDVDRENGIWRFFSQTKAYGLEKAREGLLKYKKDDREPFPDVYRLFAGDITPEGILERIGSAEISANEREKREFYAHLYIGLNHALHNRNDLARTHLAEAVKNNWGQAGSYGPHYMWQVGRVQYELLAQAEDAKPAETNKTKKRPNIVLIVADDLGYREVGCFGQKKIKTPNLDRLATEGMKLTQHYSGNAVCAPSRCVLMTGKHPGHAYIRTNKSTPPEGQEPIPASEITIAELLKDQGYVTGAFGKWGLGGPDSEGQPLKQGVDRFFGYNCQSHAHSHYPSYLWSDDKRIKLNNNPPIPGHVGLDKGADPNDPRSYDKFKGEDYAPERINRQALQFIRDNKDRPFFLYYPTIIPHVALHIPDEDLKPYLNMGWNDPPFTRANGRGYTPHFTPRAAYAAMISRMDEHVGRVLRLLEELKLADDTIVIFSSDNGTTHLEQEVDFEFFDSVGELRGLKGSLYEGGVRVPTIVRWPGRVPAGATSEYISGFEDWMPTILDLVGAKNAVPKNIDGISLAKALLGKTQKPRPFLYREFPSYGGQQSVRAGDWKGIRQNMTRGNLEIELYNLAQDPGEKNNVAKEHPEIVKKLAKIMEQEHTPSQLFPLIPIDAPAKRGRNRRN